MLADIQSWRAAEKAGKWLKSARVEKPKCCRNQEKLFCAAGIVDAAGAELLFASYLGLILIHLSLVLAGTGFWQLAGLWNVANQRSEKQKCKHKTKLLCSICSSFCLRCSQFSFLPFIFCVCSRKSALSYAAIFSFLLFGTIFFVIMLPCSERVAKWNELWKMCSCNGWSSAWVGLGRGLVASGLAAFELNYISAACTHTHTLRVWQLVIFSKWQVTLPAAPDRFGGVSCDLVSPLFQNHVKCQIGERQENGAFVLSFLLSYHSPYLLF